MGKRSIYDEASLTRMYLDLVQDYLELQRLRVEVEAAEVQQMKRKNSRRPVGAKQA